LEDSRLPIPRVEEFPAECCGNLPLAMEDDAVRLCIFQNQKKRKKTFGMGYVLVWIESCWNEVSDNDIFSLVNYV